MSDTKFMRLSVSETVPVSPLKGDGWYKISTNTFYIYEGISWEIQGCNTKFIYGLQVGWVTTSTIQIKTGICRNDTDNGNIEVVSPLIVNIAVAGANGLDTGSEEADTWYYVWVIKNPTTGTVAGLLSKSAVSPTIPSGYTKKRRVGSVRNNSSSNFKNFTVRGKGNRKKVYWRAQQLVLGWGHATDWTVVDCSSSIPATTTEAVLFVYVWYDSTDCSLSIRQSGAAYERILYCHSVGSLWVDCITDGAQKVDYKVNNALASCWVYIDAYYEEL